MGRETLANAIAGAVPADEDRAHSRLRVHRPRTENWTGPNWNFPVMIPRAGRGGFHEEVEVHGCADRFRVETGRGRGVGRGDLSQTGIAEATFCDGRKKRGGVTPSEMNRLKMLEEENSKLKRIVADLSLE